MYSRSIVVLSCFTFLLQGALIAAPAVASDERGDDEHNEVLVWQPLDELQQAADTGDPIAITKLADYYFRGPGKDVKKGVTLYEKAANRGEAHAQFSMGFALYAGFGVTWDPNKAAKWFHKAAEQGHPIAQSELSLLYFGGLGVKKNQKESYRWARRSAEQGWPVGQMRLAQSLWHGRGVAEDKREACMWSIISDIPEKNKRPGPGRCKREFGIDEFEQIQAEANEWLDAHPKARRHEYDCWISPHWLD